MYEELTDKLLEYVTILGYKRGQLEESLHLMDELKYEGGYSVENALNILNIPTGLNAGYKKIITDAIKKEQKFKNKINNGKDKGILEDEFLYELMRREEQGYLIGMIKAKDEVLNKLIKNTNLPIDEILSILNISDDQWKEKKKNMLKSKKMKYHLQHH